MARGSSLEVTGSVSRHPFLTALAALAFLGLGAPLLAFVIVPNFVKSILVEDLPADPRWSGSPAIETVRQGEFVRISAADYGSGVIRIVRTGDDRFVRFEDVDIAGAPDMYVYLSDRDDGKPGVFVDLGKLKATNGSFNYPIPASVDLAAVRSLVIWCRQFSVTITYATLR